MQYKFGTYTNANPAVAITLQLGFVPDHFVLYNYSGYATNTAVSRADWFSGMTNGYALIQTVDAGAQTVQSILTTNGFTPYSVGGSWTATVTTITGATKANPGVITSASHGLVTGDIITISGVVGMVQLNTNRYQVVKIDANTYSLKDLFGNVVDTSGYSTYVSGGQANLISSISTSPLGLEYDTGYDGITLGTSVVGAATNVMYWEAFKAGTPNY